MKEKKILLIGRFNKITQNINEYLEQYFYMQLCSDSVDMVKNLVNITSPDLILISMIGIEGVQSSIFSELKYNHASVPCLCIGKPTDQNSIKQYLRLHQFDAVPYPISNSNLLIAICEKLKLELDVKNNEIININSRRKCILLVDDNPIQLRSLRGILQNDYDIMMAVSGAETLTAIGKRVPDLIILDYEMPICDGKMTLEMIRNLEEAKDVPVVFLTAVSDKEHIHAVLELKPAGYILKPTSQNVICEIVKKLI